MSVDEEWHPVVGWEDIYEVSSLGRVRSLDRINSQGRFFPGKVLTPHLTSTRKGKVRSGAYLTVMLCQDGVKVKRHIHTLVLESFMGPRPYRCQARHGSGGALDNTVTNLSWGTPKANAADKWRDGTVLLGERHQNTKLTDAEMVVLRARYASGEGFAALAKEIGVDKRGLFAALTGATWTHLPGAVNPANRRKVA